jgi:hypothetical protein
VAKTDATAIAGILILLTVAYYFEPRSEKEVVGKNAIWTVIKISRLVIAVVTPFAVSAILVTLENVFDGSWSVTLAGLGKYTITLSILEIPEFLYTIIFQSEYKVLQTITKPEWGKKEDLISKVPANVSSLTIATKLEQKGLICYN